VLLDCGECNNFQDIFILARFVGQRGEVAVTRPLWQCSRQFVELNPLRNVKFQSRESFNPRDFDVLIVG
jgi:hypothetical protein